MNRIISNRSQEKITKKDLDKLASIVKEDREDFVSDVSHTWNSLFVPIINEI